MKRVARWLPAILVLSFFTCPKATAGEFAADFKEYRSWEDEKEKEKSGKIFVKADKSRMEFFRNGQVAEILIVDPAKTKSWLLNKEEKTYMEINFNARAWEDRMEGKGSDSPYKKESMGTESVSGYVCEKLRYTYKDKSLGEMVYWIPQKLGYPVKWETKGQEGTSWFQLTKIREGKLNDSLFDLPKGYKPMSFDDGDEEQDAERQSGKVIEEDAKDVGRDAHGAVKDGVSEGVTDAIREGIRGISHENGGRPPFHYL